MPSDENAPPREATPAEPQWVTFTQIARLVSERGYIERPITRQGVRHIADTDPAWPVPRTEWMRIGNAWAMPWPPIKEFFRERGRRGRGPAKPAAKEQHEQPSRDRDRGRDQSGRGRG